MMSGSSMAKAMDYAANHKSFPLKKGDKVKVFGEIETVTSVSRVNQRCFCCGRHEEFFAYKSKIKGGTSSGIYIPALVKKI